MDMKEGTDIEEYISKARDLKNLLAMLGEPIPERTLVNLLLNKLPHSYEDVIQKSIHYGCDAIFGRTSAKLINKFHFV
jgi:hypothetical protein